MSLDLFDIEGKVVLITGGARGIGYMLAERFVEAGAKVYISSRNRENCESAASELSRSGDCIALAADLSKVSEIERLVSEFESRQKFLNVLVNNSGTTWGDTLENFPEVGWDKVLSLNLKAPFFMIQKFLPLLESGAESTDPARIINIGSVDGLHTSIFDNISYSASKAGLHHMTKIIASKLAPRHLTVNTIAPGPFLTDMMQPMIDMMGVDAIESNVPLGRMGQSSDIGGVAIFLASKASAYITGVLLPVDGGLTSAK